MNKPYEFLFLGSNTVKDLSLTLYGIVQSVSIIYAASDYNEKKWFVVARVFFFFLAIIYFSKVVCEYALENMRFLF